MISHENLCLRLEIHFIIAISCPQTPLNKIPTHILANFIQFPGFLCYVVVEYNVLFGDFCASILGLFWIGYKQFVYVTVQQSICWLYGLRAAHLIILQGLGYLGLERVPCSELF